MTQSDLEFQIPDPHIKRILYDGSPTPIQVLKKHLKVTTGKHPEHLAVDSSIRSSARRIITVTWRETDKYGDTKVKHRTVITFEQWAGYVDSITREQKP